MKKCIVSFADEAGAYQKRMQRLKESLDGNYDGDFLGITSYQDINCEHHRVIPYKFKPYAIQKAIDLGYELILWCDSPVYAVKPLNDLFDHIEKNGYVFFDNIGYSLGDYTNDSTLNHFNITRQESWNIKMIMACVMGFNFSKTYPCADGQNRCLSNIDLVFNQYKEVSDLLYKGQWNNDHQTESKDMRVKGHRHDQSVMSAIIHSNNLDVIKGQDTFFAYDEHRRVMPIADSVCLFSAG
jgi:hypothetical protein